jgi:serine protease Do
MKKLAWLVACAVTTVAVWSPLNRVSEWERTARFEQASQQVYKVQCLWASGSGWAWDHDTIITNWHVVEGMEQFAENVTIKQGDREWTATRITRLSGVDAAMVDIDGTLTRIPQRHGYLPKPGGYLLVAGYPFGVGPIMTEGYSLGCTTPEGYVFMDAAVNPGNSGGPVFNRDMEIIGMTVQVTNSGYGRPLGIFIPLMRIVNGMERPEFRTTHDSVR